MTSREPLGLVVGLVEEEIALRSAMHAVERRPIGRWRCHVGSLGHRSVLLVRSGLGRRRAEAAAAALADRFRPVALCAAGFAGSLSEALAVGAILRARQVYLVPDPAVGEVTRCFSCASIPEPSAGTSAADSRIGVVVTTDGVLSRANAKRELGRSLIRESGGSLPLAVDMESAGVAAVAAARGLPFLAVRAITDDLSRDLPLDFSRCFDSRGDLRRSALVTQLAARPGAIPSLLRLGRDSVTAARRLRADLASVLSRWP